MDDQLLAGQRVLVVEDEMFVLMGIEDALHDLGCTAICVAASVSKALELVETRHFDLAMLDVNLNGQRSDPIAAALTARGVRFAFSTGYGEGGVAECYGDRLVLKKPYNNEQFIAVVRALLAG